MDRNIHIDTDEMDVVLFLAIIFKLLIQKSSPSWEPK